MYFCKTPGRIRMAALELIRAGGVKYATMRRIAKVVGIAPSAIYRHFDSKDHLLEECARDETTTFSNELVPFERKKPSRCYVRAIRKWVELAREHPHAFALVRDRAKEPFDPASTLLVPIWGVLRATGWEVNRHTVLQTARDVWSVLAGMATLHQAGILDRKQFAKRALECANSVSRGFSSLRITPPGYKFWWGYDYFDAPKSAKA